MLIGPGLSQPGSGHQEIGNGNRERSATRPPGSISDRRQWPPGARAAGNHDTVHRLPAWARVEISGALQQQYSQDSPL